MTAPPNPGRTWFWVDAVFPTQLALSLAAKAGKAEANSIATISAVTANNEKMRFMRNLLFLRVVGCTTSFLRPRCPKYRTKFTASTSIVYLYCLEYEAEFTNCQYIKKYNFAQLVNLAKVLHTGSVWRVLRSLTKVLLSRPKRTSVSLIHRIAESMSSRKLASGIKVFLF
jgi:hypothetical protein